MDVRTVHAEGSPKAFGPYSQAIVAGDLVFCSGQIPIDPATDQFVEGDIGAQTRRVLDNLAVVLAAAGSDLAHVTKTTVFLADLNDFNAMNETYAQRFAQHRPARSTVQVARLPRGARIEIECVAVRK